MPNLKGINGALTLSLVMLGMLVFLLVFLADLALKHTVKMGAQFIAFVVSKISRMNDKRFARNAVSLSYTTVLAVWLYLQAIGVKLSAITTTYADVGASLLIGLVAGMIGIALAITTELIV